MLAPPYLGAPYFYIVDEMASEILIETKGLALIGSTELILSIFSRPPPCILMKLMTVRLVPKERKGQGAMECRGNRIDDRPP